MDRTQMGSSATEPVTSALTKALEDLEAERKAWEESIKRTRAKFDQRAALIREALSLDGAMPMLDPADRPSSDGSNGLSVGIDKVNAVRQLLSRKGRMRQADIGKVLDMNSGTVSVALRRLQEEGDACSGEPEDGSRTWELIQGSQN